MTVAFVACAEAGYLEAQIVLLCRSLREHGGPLARAPVHVVSPRRGFDIAASTKSQLRELGVDHHVDVLNRDFTDHPTCNKVFAAAWAEEHLDAETIVFVDSDSIFVNPPVALDLPAGIDVGVRPVELKNIGSRGWRDRNDRYWRSLLQRCGATHRRFVETTAGGERIRAYYNSGLVAGRRDAGFFAEWLRCLRVLVEAGLRPPHGRWIFADQLSLAAAAGRYARVELFDPSYNYPLPKRRLLAPPWDTTPLDDLVHVHYHRWFAKPGFLGLLDPPVDLDGRVARWLAPQLPLEPLHDDRLPTSGRGARRR